ncbi:MAG TPA: hypothetical protein VGD45_04785 [Steroidobacter sp.]|uniref:hypothetical protein n=1 Tax=Steroidobacter sp. TaxID=1978227 RepID=UPI002EDAEA27
MRTAEAASRGEPSAQLSRWTLVLLRLEMLVCLGPTFVYLPTAVVLVPHQLRLAIGENLTESWIPVAYYVGVACLFIGVLSIWKWLRTRRRLLSRLPTTCLLSAGICVLPLGPVGTFALGGFEGLTSLAILIFIVLPLSSVLHLGFLARDYLCAKIPA